MRIGLRVGDKPGKKSFSLKVGGVIQAVMEKAGTGLVRKEVEVHRRGKTFKQMRWVRPDEASQAKTNKAPEQGGEKKTAAPDTPREQGQVKLQQLTQEMKSGKISRREATEEAVKIYKQIDRDGGKIRTATTMIGLLQSKGKKDTPEYDKWATAYHEAKKESYEREHGFAITPNNEWKDWNIGEKQAEGRQPDGTYIPTDKDKEDVAREEKARPLKEEWQKLEAMASRSEKNGLDGAKEDREKANEAKKKYDEAMNNKQQETPKKRLGIRVRKPKNEGFKGSVALGDRIRGKNAFSKKMVVGKVVQKRQDGAIVETTDGTRFKIPWNKIKRVVKPINDHDSIRQLYDKKGISRNWRGEGEKGLQPESCDTIDGLLKACETDRKNLDNVTEEYAHIFADLAPVLIKRPKLKGIKRIKEKLREDELKENANGAIYDKETDTYHCRTIRDTDGHTLTLKNIADVGKLLDAFNKDERIIRIKNNFSDPSTLGYSDINMNIRLPNGTVAEIQLNTTANLVAKERYGHSMYEVWRTFESVDNSVKEKHAELIDLMVEGQKALYAKSNEYSKEGTYKLSAAVQEEIDKGNSGAFFNEENPEYARIVKPFIEKAIPLLGKAIDEGLFPDNMDEGKENETIVHFRDLRERLKLGFWKD